MIYHENVIAANKNIGIIVATIVVRNQGIERENVRSGHGHRIR